MKSDNQIEALAKLIAHLSAQGDVRGLQLLAVIKPEGIPLLPHQIACGGAMAVAGTCLVSRGLAQFVAEGRRMLEDARS